jgi:hypothetical protein
MGVAATRWPTFNVADMAVTGGAVALAIMLWKEEGREDVPQPAPLTHTPPIGDNQRETAV